MELWHNFRYTACSISTCQQRTAFLHWNFQLHPGKIMITLISWMVKKATVTELEYSRARAEPTTATISSSSMAAIPLPPNLVMVLVTCKTANFSHLDCRLLLLLLLLGFNMQTKYLRLRRITPSLRLRFEKLAASSSVSYFFLSLNPGTQCVHPR